MKHLSILLTLIFCLNSSCAVARNIGNKYENIIINSDGDKIGGFILTQGNEGVLLEIKLSGLKTGKHGMHIHESGTCDYSDNFNSAKGHVMQKGKPHGFLNINGPHAGNLPNLIVDKHGDAHVELYTQLLSLNGLGKLPSLFDEDGASLVIHETEDDHFSQPIGGSGKRVACGIIQYE